MEQQKAIEIAATYLVSQQRSVDGYVAHVISPSATEVEIAFGVNADAPAAYRVFLGQFGHFIGLVSEDGTSSEGISDSELERVRGEDHVIAATRYLAAHGVDTTNLRARIVDPPGLTTVWYSLDTDEDIMGGGGPLLYISDCGTFIRMYETQ